MFFSLSLLRLFRSWNKYIFMRRLLFSLLLLGMFTSPSQAQQVEQVTIGVNGLHCSACSFTVEKSLMKVDFVSVVMMDLNDRIARVILNDAEETDFHKLAKAVTDAGYSVRDVVVTLGGQSKEDQSCLTIDNNNFCLIDLKSDSNEFRLIDKDFMPKKEFKKMQDIPAACSSCGTDKNRYIAQWF